MRRLALATAAAALVATPALAASPCLTDSEAQAVTSVALPDLIAETGRVCAVALPATAIVRQTNGGLIAKYAAEADRAWPAARAALVKLSDPAIAPLLELDLARPLLSSLLVLQIVGRINVADCPTIDRLVTLVAPLPPRNTAGIVVTTLRYLKAEKAKRTAVVQDVPDLPICAIEP